VVELTRIPNNPVKCPICGKAMEVGLTAANPLPEGLKVEVAFNCVADDHSSSYMKKRVIPYGEVAKW